MIVGSGNTTLSGGQDNDELWTVLRAGPDGTPATIGPLADWLRGLPSVVTFTDGVGTALERTAWLLERLEPTEAGGFRWHFLLPNEHPALLPEGHDPLHCAVRVLCPP